MITITIRNAEAVARKQAGWLKLMVGKNLLRMDIEAKVEAEIARRIREEFARQGVEADVQIERPPQP